MESTFSPPPLPQWPHPPPPPPPLPPPTVKDAHMVHIAPRGPQLHPTAILLAACWQQQGLKFPLPSINRVIPSSGNNTQITLRTRRTSKQPPVIQGSLQRQPGGQVKAPRAQRENIERGLSNSSKNDGEDGEMKTEETEEEGGVTGEGEDASEGNLKGKDMLACYHCNRSYASLNSVRNHMRLKHSDRKGKRGGLRVPHTQVTLAPATILPSPSSPDARRGDESAPGSLKRIRDMHESMEREAAVKRPALGQRSGEDVPSSLNQQGDGLTGLDAMDDDENMHSSSDDKGDVQESVFTFPGVDRKESEGKEMEGEGDEELEGDLVLVVEGVGDKETSEEPEVERVDDQKWTDGKDYRCPYCPLKYTSLGSMRNHVRLKHRALPGLGNERGTPVKDGWMGENGIGNEGRIGDGFGNENGEGKTEKIPIKASKKKKETNENADGASEIAKPERVVPCPECGRMYASVKSLANHVRDKHREKKSAPPTPSTVPKSDVPMANSNDENPSQTAATPIPATPTSNKPLSSENSFLPPPQPPQQPTVRNDYGYRNVMPSHAISDMTRDNVMRLAPAPNAQQMNHGMGMGGSMQTVASIGGRFPPPQQNFNFMRDQMIQSNAGRMRSGSEQFMNFPVPANLGQGPRGGFGNFSRDDPLQRWQFNKQQWENMGGSMGDDPSAALLDL